MGVSKLYWLHTLSPMHIGAGQGVGFIDLPIMREKLTNWPIVPGTAIKGVMRDAFENVEGEGQKKLVRKAFGPRTSDEAGSLVFTDARIVLLPIRSYFGTYAYVTSPLALQRLKRDMLSAGENQKFPDFSLENNQVLVHNLQTSKLTSEGKVYLEELDFTIQEDPQNIAKNWAEFLANSLFSQEEGWKEIFLERFAIVSNDMFNFLCEIGTEVNARVKINTNKIVQPGALWYEESLPVEAVLAGIVWCDRIYGDRDNFTPESIMETVCNEEKLLQLGGKASVGKGRVRCIFSNKGVEKK